MPRWTEESESDDRRPRALAAAEEAAGPGVPELAAAAVVGAVAGCDVRGGSSRVCEGVQ